MKSENQSDALKRSRTSPIIIPSNKKDKNKEKNLDKGKSKDKDLDKDPDKDKSNLIPTNTVPNKSHKRESPFLARKGSNSAAQAFQDLQKIPPLTLSPLQRKLANSSPDPKVGSSKTLFERKNSLPIDLKTHNDNFQQEQTDTLIDEDSKESEEQENQLNQIEKEASIWSLIDEFNQDNDSIIIPANSTYLRELLEKKIPRKLLSKYGPEIPNFDQRYIRSIGQLTVREILTTFPEMLEKFEKLNDFNFSENEKKIFSELLTENNKFKTLRKDILELMSFKNKNAANKSIRLTKLAIKLLSYYAPANSEYVLKLIGEVKYKNIIANIIYMLAGIAKFTLKQYKDELQENTDRLNDTYREIEEILKLFVSRKIIIYGDEDKLKTTADIQMIMFLIIRSWHEVFEITNSPLKQGQKHDANIKSIKDIHPVKALEYTLNMFIALSKNMLERKSLDPNFFFDAELGNVISQEFAILIANNLQSTSFTGAIFEAVGLVGTSSANSSVSSITLGYKLNIIDKLMNVVADKAEAEKDIINDKIQYINNDEKIKDSVDSLIDGITRERKFVLDTAFTKVVKVNENGIIIKTKEDKVSEDLELTEVMKKISLAIASEAGIKISKRELKYLLIAKTLITLLVSYLLNTMVLKRWFSVPLQILINLHGIDYLNSYLQSFINMKEEEARDEYNKYNIIDKEFNSTIETLLQQDLLYPILNDKYEIEYILCDSEIKVYLRIIAIACKELQDSIDINKVSPQDISALSKSMFNALCFYSISNEGEKRKKYELKEVHINDIAEFFADYMKANLEKKDDSYKLKNSPKLVFELFQKSLVPYMKSRQIDISNSPLNSPELKSLNNSKEDISLISSDLVRPSNSAESLINSTTNTINFAKSFSIKRRVNISENPIEVLSSAATKAGTSLSPTINKKKSSTSIEKEEKWTDKISTSKSGSDLKIKSLGISRRSVLNIPNNDIKNYIKSDDDDVSKQM